jgi:hypothetical protein
MDESRMNQRPIGYIAQDIGKIKKLLLIINRNKKQKPKGHGSSFCGF